MKPVFVKLLTLWMIDDEYQSTDLSPVIIGHGIWETRGVDEINGDRIYDLVCVTSYHKDLKVGDKRRMNEESIMVLCHEVKLIHLPKVNKRDVIIDSVLK